MWLIALPLGALIGLSLGALGGGGSILTVPALVYLLGQEPHTATTSSLLIVGGSSLIALVPHARAGRVRAGQGLVFGVLGIVGSFAGSTLSSRVPPHLLLLAFAGLVLLVAALMLRRAGRARAEEQPADAEPAGVALRRGLNGRRVAQLLAAATVVGLFTGFFGVGGGFVLVPALVLALEFPMPTAVGTSLLVICVNSVTALAFRAGGGWDINWPVVGTFVLAAMAASLLGGRVAGRVSSRRLTIAFALLLVAVGVYTAARSTMSLI